MPTPTIAMQNDDEQRTAVPGALCCRRINPRMPTAMKPALDMTFQKFGTPARVRPSTKS